MLENSINSLSFSAFCQKTQGKNSRVRQVQIHYLTKIGRICKPGLDGWFATKNSIFWRKNAYTFGKNSSPIVSKLVRARASNILLVGTTKPCNFYYYSTFYYSDHSFEPLIPFNYLWLVTERLSKQVRWNKNNSLWCLAIQVLSLW